jgi:hypothetical protein
MQRPGLVLDRRVDIVWVEMRVRCGGRSSGWESRTS